MKEEGARKKERGGRREAGGKVRSGKARKVLRLLIASSFILQPSSFSWAAHPLVTDDTGTQGAGNWQLELQAERARLDRTADAGAGAVQQVGTTTVFTPVLTYGLRENLDMALGLNHVRSRVRENGVLTDDVDGMGDSALELKWRFYEAGGLSFALKPGLALPTGDENRGLGTGEYSWAVNFIASYEAKPWTILGNVAYNHVRYRLAQDAAQSRADLWRVSGGLGYSVTDTLRLVGEVGARTNPSRDDPFLPGSTGRFAMAGAIYSPADKIDLDIGFRKSLNDAEPDSTILMGATFRW